MFSPRKTDSGSLPANGLDSEKLSTPSSYVPPYQSAATDRGKGANHSIVDECLTMRGDLESDGDILVRGKVIGNIKCKLLIVDAEALVEGGIKAEDVVIRGRTKGVIDANRVKLEKTANVDSEICHNTFSAEEGARIKGALKLREDAAGGKAN
jgi:cytoskeletal protein CcmA (bactofilin family)